MHFCGDLGSPLEYLDPAHEKTWQRLLGTATPAETLEELTRRRTSPSGWFGLKAHWRQYEAARHTMNIDTFLPVEAIIRIVRDDTIRQAVSFAMAKQSGAWISHHRASGPLSYDFEHIRDAHSRNLAECAAWETDIASTKVKPLYVTYEKLVASPEAHVELVRDHLGLGACEAAQRPGPMRQANDLNDAWRTRYLADLGRDEA